MSKIYYCILCWCVWRTHFRFDQTKINTRSACSRILKHIFARREVPSHTQPYRTIASEPSRACAHTLCACKTAATPCANFLPVVRPAPSARRVAHAAQQQQQQQTHISSAVCAHVYMVTTCTRAVCERTLCAGAPVVLRVSRCARARSGKKSALNSHPY